jgi:FkbM family methyltransferase
MEIYLRKFIPHLNPAIKKIIYQVYKIYAFIRYARYFNKFLFFRGIYINVGRDISMLPAIKLNIYEKTELDFLESIQLQANSVFWDVGANVGLYSVLFAKLNPTWKIYSFEPNSEVHKKFHKNIKFNNINNIQLIPLALSDSKEKVSLRINQNRPGTSSIYSKTGKFVRSKIIECISGDELFLSGKIPAPDLIKIDVEGYELKVLNGLKIIVSNYMPVIAIEVAISVWKSPNEFDLYLNYLNDLLLIYNSGILITNGTQEKIFGLDTKHINNSIQTLILVPPKRD